ncbi:18172_t:CDS:1, partial [Cetraspora pellucida]
WQLVLVITCKHDYVPGTSISKYDYVPGINMGFPNSTITM